VPLIFVLKIQKDQLTRTKVIVQKSDRKRQDHTIIRPQKFYKVFIPITCHCKMMNLIGKSL